MREEILDSIKRMTKDDCFDVSITLGLFYASKKKKWYKKPDGYKSFKHRPVAMDKIRIKYGSEVVV